MTCLALRLKTIAAAALIANLGPMSAVQAQKQVDSDKIQLAFLEKARASIVVLTGEDKAGMPVAPGLGFWIGENLIATDNRVIQSAVRVHVTIPGQQSNIVQVISRDDYRLAAVLTTTKSTHAPALPVGDSERFVATEMVYLVGDPASQSSASGTRLATTVVFNEGSYFKISAPLSSASRGGPVLNNKGEVIGIAGEGLGGLSETLVIPSEYLTRARRDRYVAKGGGMGSGEGMGTGAGVGPGAPSTGPGYGTGRIGESPKVEGQPQPDNSVDTKPVPLKSFIPRYTEEARKNQVQGVVMMRILVGEDGDVKQVRIVRGLPDGLSETAIAGAYQMKFKPATKNGLPVSHWIVVTAEYHLR